MKAIGYRTAGPVSAPGSLQEVDLPAPQPGPRDLRVAVRAISVNPADVKMRARVQPPAGEIRIPGFDAAGIVEAVGNQVTLFRPGDEVFYAGAIDRPGTYSELHVVDERIVGRKPKMLNFSQAAALPLTAITGWEILFDRLAVPYGVKSHVAALLIVNGAGGVGSILTQMARRLTGLTVIATASRPETVAWCREMGAHHVIDHHRPFTEELGRLGIPQVEYVASLTATDRHLRDIEAVLAPQGRLALIDDPDVLDVVCLKRKSISVHWELMFTRPLFQTADMIAQHRILNEVADLLDAGLLQTTMTAEGGPIDTENLKRAHALVESGRAIGKTVLTGFQK